MSLTSNRRLFMASALGVLLVLAPPRDVIAEGACPPGSYPVGGQGVQGCAPIPGGSGAAAAPRPSGRWIKTWGAIAVSADGAAGAADGRRSKGEASRDAMEVCIGGGGKSCEVGLTYKNQCAAASAPTSGKGGTLFGKASTIEAARQVSFDHCVAGGGIGCRLIYSACSKPVFESF